MLNLPFLYIQNLPMQINNTVFTENWDKDKCAKIKSLFKIKIKQLLNVHKLSNNHEFISQYKILSSPQK